MITENLGSFLVLEKIGQGGMGSVFQAEDERGQIIALKVLSPELLENNKARERFVLESQVLRTLEHENIVKALSEAQESDGHLFYAMEWIQDCDLNARLKKSARLDLKESLSVTMDILSALQFAHDKGVLHRDVKPSNIFVDSKNRAKLGDFGLARLMDVTRLTATGSTLGTPEYMSPEQAEGKELDARSDIYSVGILLYHLLSGQPPFQSSHPLAVLKMHTDKAPEPLPRHLAPPEIQTIVHRALEKNPVDRWSSAAAMKDALEQVKSKLEQQETTVLAPPALSNAQLNSRQSEALEPLISKSTRKRRMLIPILFVAAVGTFIAIDLPSSRVDQAPEKAIAGQLRTKSGQDLKLQSFSIDLDQGIIAAQTGPQDTLRVPLHNVESLTKYQSESELITVKAKQLDLAAFLTQIGRNNIPKPFKLQVSKTVQGRIDVDFTKLHWRAVLAKIANDHQLELSIKSGLIQLRPKLELQLVQFTHSFFKGETRILEFLKPFFFVRRQAGRKATLHFCDAPQLSQIFKKRQEAKVSWANPQLQSIQRSRATYPKLFSQPKQPSWLLRYRVASSNRKEEMTITFIFDSFGRLSAIEASADFWSN